MEVPPAELITDMKVLPAELITDIKVLLPAELIANMEVSPAELIPNMEVSPAELITDMKKASDLISNIKQTSNLYKPKMSNSAFYKCLGYIIFLFKKYGIFVNDDLDLKLTCGTKRTDIKDKNTLEIIFNHIIECILGDNGLKTELVNYFIKQRVIKSQSLFYSILIIIGAEFYTDPNYCFSLGGGYYANNLLFSVKLYNLINTRIFEKDIHASANAKSPRTSASTKSPISSIKRGPGRPSKKNTKSSLASKKGPGQLQLSIKNNYFMQFINETNEPTFMQLQECDEFYDNNNNEPTFMQLQEYVKFYDNGNNCINESTLMMLQKCAECYDNDVV
jgi:hypothetical protein